MSTRPSAANTPTTATTSPVEDPPEAEKFTGHDWDSASRLYYTAYRYYSPDANRWLTRDPLGMVDGPNVYAYVMNNPVSMWDALGQCGTNAQTLPGGGGGGGGGAFSTYPAEILGAVVCIAAFFLLLLATVYSFGRTTSLGNASLACATCIGLAIALYLAMGWDPSTSPGVAIAGLLGAVCVTACVLSFLTMQVLAVGPFGAQTMVYSSTHLSAAGAWFGIGAGVTDGFGCGVAIASLVGAIR